MATNRLFRLAAAAVLLLAAVSCIYPFEPDFQTTDGRLVVEGGIHIGDVSTFTFSRVTPFSAEEDYTPGPLRISAYIEGEDGSRLNPTPLEGVQLTFDTMDIPADKRYRLHFTELYSGLEYESDWLDVNPAPHIDELRYILDPDRKELNVALSMHCQGQSHFRWYYQETWEYHTPLWATHYLDYSLMYNASGEYTPERAFVKYESGENNYYCWNTLRSPDLKIFSTADQVADRFTDLEFHRLSSSDNKLAIVYKLTVYLESMSEYEYRYWRNIEENTQEQGSVFSPTPSQMAGNIHCVTDPSAEVIGFVGAARQDIAHMYYINQDEQFYDGHQTTWREVNIEDVYDPDEFIRWYYKGYAPYTMILPEMGGPGTIWQWAPVACVDCRKIGGTKDKPEGWPNNHI